VDDDQKLKKDEKQKEENQQQQEGGGKERQFPITAIEPRNGEKAPILTTKNLDVSWRVLLPRQKTAKTTTGNSIQNYG
jgi:hypothetical protein